MCFRIITYAYLYQLILAYTVLTRPASRLLGQSYLFGIDRIGARISGLAAKKTKLSI
jgi:hypothetical protein